MRTWRPILWGIALLLLGLVAACQRPNDALVHQMQELRKELADLKSQEKKQEEPVKALQLRDNYQSVQTVGGPHMGSTLMFLSMRPHYYWPRMQEDIEAFCKGCLSCMYTRPSTVKQVGLKHRAKAPLIRPGQRLAVDLRQMILLVGLLLKLLKEVYSIS